MGKYRVSTPASSAGVVRYMDVKTSGIQVEPQHILLIAVGIIVGISIIRLFVG